MINIFIKQIVKLIDKWSLGWLGLLLLLRFWPMILGKTLFFGDNYSLMIPGKIFTALWLRQGVFPMWDPYLMSGISWIGDVSQSIFYPSTFLFTIFHPAIALNLTIIFNLIVSWLGMMYLSKKVYSDKNISIIASILWTFSTQLTGSINNLSTIQSLVWLPWIVGFGLLVAEKRMARFWLAIAVFFQFAGGYPQHVVYSIFASVIFSLLYINKKEWKKWLICWCETAIWTLSLSAVIWLPFVDLLLKSTRMLQTADQAGVGSLEPLMSLKLLLPYIFDSPSLGIKWGPAWSGQPNMVFYLTWIGLLAIVQKTINWKKFSKVDLFFLCFTVFSLIFSLGSNLPGFELVQKIIPFFKVGRYPSMVLILTSLFLSLWSAKLIFSIKLSTFSKGQCLFLGLSFLGVVSLWLLSRLEFNHIWFFIDQFLDYRLSHGVFHNLERDRSISLMISQNLLINSVLFLLALFSIQKKKLKLLILVIGLDMIFNTQGNFFFAPNHIYPNWQQIKEPQHQLLGQDFDYQQRLLTRNSNVPYTDFGSYWEAMVVRYPFSDSFVDVKELENVGHAVNLRKGLTMDWNIVNSVKLIQGYTTMLPQDYAAIWNNNDIVRINFLDKVDPHDPKLQDWAVGYYLVDHWFDTSKEVFDYPVVVESSRWTLYQLPAKSRFRFEDDQAAELVNYQENPNKIIFEIDNKQSHRYLIVADRFDKDWTVVVNGQNVQIINHQGMRKIAIGDGVQTIELIYFPKLFYIGLIVSLMTGIAMLSYLQFLSKQSN